MAEAKTLACVFIKRDFIDRCEYSGTSLTMQRLVIDTEVVLIDLEKVAKKAWSGGQPEAYPKKVKVDSNQVALSTLIGSHATEKEIVDWVQKNWSK